MHKSIKIFFVLAAFAGIISAQGFKVKTAGVQTFNFADERGRNHVSFFSTAPLEDITGTASGVSGTVSFDPANFAKTLKGKIGVKVATMNTGIELRNEHLRGPNWFDAGNYPDVTFEIKSVSDLKQAGDNKIEFKVEGDFTFHGVTKEITADAEAAYLEENEQTQKRAPGDLLGVRAKFYVKLSDYDVDNQLIGSKVAEDIEVSVNMVGSNKM
ncbi:MAG: YceI family protein [Ignavibacteriales bacterium]|nr:YceI family protein [Ignavibacteriales bacterium]